MAFKETLCCGQYRKNSKYREHSSVRDTLVNNHSEGTHLVRVRSQKEHKNKMEHTVFRSCSFHATETTAYPEKWRYGIKEQKYKTSILKNGSNNNEANSKLTETDESKEDSDININISIHLHK